MHLDLLNIQVGELLAAQRAADQQCEDRVIALSFNRRAVGDRKQLFCLLPGQPVAEPSSLLRDIRDLVRFAASSALCSIFRLYIRNSKQQPRTFKLPPFETELHATGHTSSALH